MLWMKPMGSAHEGYQCRQMLFIWLSGECCKNNSCISTIYSIYRPCHYKITLCEKCFASGSYNIVVQILISIDKAQFTRAVAYWYKCCWALPVLSLSWPSPITWDHILLSHWRLGFLSVASYDLRDMVEVVQLSSIYSLNIDRCCL
jgi:hypothetical protein